MSSSSVTLRMLPPAGLLARVRRVGTDTGSLRLVERHARAYRRAWLVFISGVFEPLFYLLSVGLGLGALVGKVPGPGGQLIPYREFVAPGAAPTPTCSPGRSRSPCSARIRSSRCSG